MEAKTLMGKGVGGIGSGAAARSATSGRSTTTDDGMGAIEDGTAATAANARDASASATAAERVRMRISVDVLSNALYWRFSRKVTGMPISEREWWSLTGKIEWRGVRVL